MPGKNKEKLVIIDADALISFVVVDDENHKVAKQIMEHLAASQSTVLFPVTAICEAVTVLRKKLNKPEEASHIVEKLRSGNFPLQEVDEKILSYAVMLFDPQGSKQNTLFDAVIASIAKQFDADAIFSFDQWYRKLGFPIASDLFEAS